MPLLPGWRAPLPSPSGRSARRHRRGRRARAPRLRAAAPSPPRPTAARGRPRADCAGATTRRPSPGGPGWRRDRPDARSPCCRSSGHRVDRCLDRRPSSRGYPFSGNREWRSGAGLCTLHADVATADQHEKSGATDADELGRKLSRAGYLASEELALVSWLALALERPLLVEGPAGVGKTDLARALAEALGRELVRLQCYEGLDEAKALYEWDYAKQMLYTQLLRDAVGAQTAGAGSLAEAADRVAGADAAFFSRRFLVERPLLRALTSETPVVMLVDEVDRADPEF